MEIQSSENKKVSEDEILSTLRNTGAIEINHKELN
jgi:hypothetical protein